ncbi:MAG: hypothetical protein EP330_03820 [Deltaproteobacteria bacterium]|nr:MAG: hypothetical protein EP330_03820 [Deltaproteobacteria bacterium]
MSDLCTVDGSLDLSEGLPGATVVFTGRPTSELFDTVVHVGGVEAEVVSVDRSDDCVFCDACVTDADCTGCETSCADCDAVCETCVETTTFLVPDLLPQETTVVLQNLWGSTDPIPFTVLGEDTGYTGARRRRTQGFRLPSLLPFTN